MGIEPKSPGEIPLLKISILFLLLFTGCRTTSPIADPKANVETLVSKYNGDGTFTIQCDAERDETIAIDIFRNQPYNVCNGKQPICIAHGYAGSTLALALQSCQIKGRLSLSECVQDVSCSPAVPLCTAKKYSGPTLDVAIFHCQNFGEFSHSVCLQNTTCSAAISLCKAGGIVGPNFAAAIYNCQSMARWSRDQCLKDISCSADIKFCRAGGYAGETAKEASTNCELMNRAPSTQCGEPICG